MINKESLTSDGDVAKLNFGESWSRSNLFKIFFLCTVLLGVGFLVTIIGLGAKVGSQSSDLDTYQKNYYDCRDKSVAKDTEISNLKSDLSKAQTENAQLKIQVKNLTDNNTSMAKQLTECTSNLASAKTQVLIWEIGTGVGGALSLGAGGWGLYEYFALGTCNTNLNTCNADLAKANTNIASLKGEISKLNDKVKNLEDEKIVLTQKVKDLTTENTQLKVDKDKLVDDNKKLTDANTALTKENTDLKAERGKLIEDNKKLTDSNTALTKENTDLKAEKDKLIKENTDLKAKLDTALNTIKTDMPMTLYGNGMTKKGYVKKLDLCYDSSTAGFSQVEIIKCAELGPIWLEFTMQSGKTYGFITTKQYEKSKPTDDDKSFLYGLENGLMIDPIGGKTNNVIQFKSGSLIDIGNGEIFINEGAGATTTATIKPQTAFTTPADFYGDTSAPVTITKVTANKFTFTPPA